MKNILIILISVLSIFAGCTTDKSKKISGAGATFPAPFYNIVFRKYTAAGGSQTTYGSMGSGGGVRSLKDKTVDFGATDVFLSDKDLAKIGIDIIHVPTALGAIVLSYNLPAVKELKLNADLVTDIYLGKITNWNDAKIKELNPDTEFPNKRITPIYRSDGSGTTAVFSEYMSKVNEAWKAEIGKGKSLKFPKGVAAKGNPGVAGIIAETEGSLGYIGSEYALTLNIPTAAMQNSSGNFIKADEKSISASADIEIPADTRTVITNSTNPDAYPISTFTWIIVYKEQHYNNRTKAEAQVLQNLLRFVVSAEGQSIAVKTSYAPLSGKALEITISVIESMTYDGHAISMNEYQDDIQ